MSNRKRTTVRLRPRPRASAPAAQGFAVFTALDGTLLDERTFNSGPAREIVRRLVNAGVPIVPVSVMTLDEVAPIAAELGLQHAMAIEAGGAIARWVDGAWQVEPCGPPAETWWSSAARTSAIPR